jgi:hypothetical protein
LRRRPIETVRLALGADADNRIATANDLVVTAIIVVSVSGKAATRRGSPRAFMAAPFNQCFAFCACR